MAVRPLYPVTMLAANTQGSMPTMSVVSTPRRSVEVDEVQDEGHRPCNVRPSNVSCIIESSDGSDDFPVRNAARAVSVINVNDESSDETDEAERGTILYNESIRNVLILIFMQIALQRIGTHQSTHSSIPSHLLIM